MTVASPELIPELVHATCVVIDGRGVLIEGASGSGKSDLALRLIDRGATLVSDDYTELHVEDGALVAKPPYRIAGKIEVRGVGILDEAFVPHAPVALAVSLDAVPQRLPEPVARHFADRSVPLLALSGWEASAPIKVERALALTERE